MLKEENNLSNMNFKEFVLENSRNRYLLRLAIPALVLQFILFKYFYPFAGFINGDSYVYLESAYHNLFVNTYPIGYSKFLRLISVFTVSDTVVVAVQYFLLVISTYFFILTVFYFYNPLRITRILFFVFFLFNPVYLYLANYISSDSLFLSLSLMWFSLLLWIVNCPSRPIVFINAVLLFVTFTVRYNALFYPFVSIVIILLARRRVWLNIAGFAVSMLLIMIFVELTSQTYERVSGYKQFTPFSGWQLANNALYAYRFVGREHRVKPPDKFREIDKRTQEYFDSTRNFRKYPQEEIMAGTVYMWAPNSPLTIYMNDQFRSDSTASALKKWASVAPMMKDYGSYLIKTYPTEFLRYFLIPNALKYYAPPVEFLDHYSTGVDSVNFIARAWFGYSSNKITTRFKDFSVNSLNYFPVLVGMMNVIFFFGIIGFIYLRGYTKSPRLRTGLLLAGLLWATNFGFSVFASSIALRFQLFPIIVSLAFSFLLIEFLVKSSGIASVGVGDASEDGILTQNIERNGN